MQRPKDGIRSKVQVFVRVRPPLDSEAEAEQVVGCDSAGPVGASVVVRDPRTLDSDSKFIFSRVFTQRATQEDVFELVRPALEHVLRGYNASAIAYGATGGGKTYTMEGPSEAPGITPRAVRFLFERGHTPPARFWVSCLQVYVGKVYDLLEPRGSDLPVREAPGHEVVVPGLSEVEVMSPEHFAEVYGRAVRNRTTAATALNDVSSRSHAIVRIRVQRDGRLGVLHLVDLAGSEDNRRTNNRGVRMQESSEINMSLFVLGQCIEALACHKNRVPYRDAKLTRLLRDALGGNSFTTLICNIAPTLAMLRDTTAVLQYGAKAGAVVNLPKQSERSGAHLAQPSMKEKLEAWREQRRKSGAAGLAPATPRACPTPTVGGEDASIVAASAAGVAAAEEGEEAKEAVSGQASSGSAFRVTTGSLTPCKSSPRAPLLPHGFNVRKMLTPRKVTGHAQRPPASPHAPRSPAARNPTVYRAALTPHTRVGQAKAVIQAARKAEAEGQLEEALESYRQAMELLPGNEKLKAKIASIHAKMRRRSDESMGSPPPRTPTKGGEDENKAPDTTAEVPATPPLEAPNTATKVRSQQLRQELRDAVEQEMVDLLNSGSLTELMSLKMIGKKRAQQIMEHREAGGSFSSLKDLCKVGLSAKQVEQISNLNMATV